MRGGCVAAARCRGSRLGQIHGDEFVTGEIGEWGDSQTVGVRLVGIVGPHKLQIGIENFTSRWCGFVGRGEMGLELGGKHFPKEPIVLIQRQMGRMRRVAGQRQRVMVGLRGDANAGKQQHEHRRPEHFRHGSMPKGGSNSD